ncbi:MAG TPA: MBL fold metallo-hydrolase, partial [Terriglobales bacterium]|nr:MBL fold metallo-hydrolase [Terriglobales bacterium]
THAHSDHLSGLPAIIANFRPEELWLGTESQAKGYEPVVEAARQYGTTVKRYSTGDQIAFGTARLAVLNPPKGFVAATHRNEDSLVMQAFYGQTSALLTGDAERKTEGEIAGIAEKASLLKVAHHGSGSSTTPELLKKTQPGFAVISAGYRNLYGHPRADVLARLRAAQVRTYRTDISGAVTFYLDGQQVTVSLPNRR